MVSGKWRYPNGTFFEGTFDNNKPKGKGRWQFENGNSVHGEYIQTRTAAEEEQASDNVKLSWVTTSDITKNNASD